MADVQTKLEVLETENHRLVESNITLSKKIQELEEENNDLRLVKIFLNILGYWQRIGEIVLTDHKSHHITILRTEANKKSGNNKQNVVRGCCGGHVGNHLDNDTNSHGSYPSEPEIMSKKLQQLFNHSVFVIHLVLCFTRKLSRYVSCLRKNKEI